MYNYKNIVRGVVGKVYLDKGTGMGKQKKYTKQRSEDLKIKPKKTTYFEIFVFKLNGCPQYSVQ